MAKNETLYTFRMSQANDRAPILDFSIPDAMMRRRGFSWAMRKPVWDVFFEETAHAVFARGGLIVDIGGGLRVDATRGDRLDRHRLAMVKEHLDDPRVRFIVTDYTDKYHPDRIEDVHALSFKDDEIDGLFCLAVLEHVYDPKKACEELLRVMKKGATALIYVPFIYRYHGNVTVDYRDYFRYSKDGIAYLFRGCSELELCPVRGIFESLLRFTPLHAIAPLRVFLRMIDWGTARMRKISERQTSGYFIRVVK
jgi:SAM-dependent methyltransferase